MKLALDCRMIGSGGIGTYFLSLLPYFLTDFECLLIGDEKIINEKIRQISTRISSENHLENQSGINSINRKNFLPYKTLQCDVETFSLKELFFFPQNLIAQITGGALFAFTSPQFVRHLVQGNFL